MKILGFLTLLLCSWECYCWPHYHYRRQRSNTTEPRIRAYSPRGFRVTLDTMRGPSSIKFSGTIFRDEENIPIEGTFVREGYRHQNRKWVFEDKSLTMKIGDVLNYEIFSETKGGTSYKTYDGNVEIHELLDYNTCSRQYCRPLNAHVPATDEPPQIGAVTAPTTIKPTTPNPLEPKLRSCQQSVISTTNVLLDLQSNVIKLETKNELLMKLLEKSPDARRLTLTGVIPNEGSPADTVNFIVWEKLDIKPHLISAIRQNATTIVFEVETVEEKLDILEEAEDRLATGRIMIV